jgi:hypothetical protein
VVVNVIWCQLTTRGCDVMPKGVYERTEEWTKEWKKKVSNGNKKKWEDVEYQNKVSDAHKHLLDEKWKQNISKAMSGVNKTCKTKSKMKEYCQNRSETHEKNMREGWKEQWNSLTKAEQLDRLEPWIKAGHESRG